jgi:hypothetical protein
MRQLLPGGLRRQGDATSPQLWQGSLGLGYTWTAREGLDAYVRGNATYSGNYVRTYSEGVNGFIGSIRDGQSITDATLRAGVKSGAWEASIFVKNLTNNSTPQFEDVGTHPGTYVAQAIRSISLRPRTIRVILKIKLNWQRYAAPGRRLHPWRR